MNVDQSHIDNLVAAAHRHHLAGRLAEAEAGYLDALRLKPKHTDALHYLGVLRTQQNDAESAVKLITRAIKQGPETVDMHLNLGAAYSKADEPSRAVYAYRKALAMKPDLPAAHFNLGHALRLARDFDGAVAAYKSYLEDRPEDVPGLLGLGCALAGAHRLADAMTAFDAAITFDPGCAEGYNKIGTLLSDWGRFHTSLAFHEKALELAPQIPEWRMDLAVGYLRMGRLKEGWASYGARCDREHNRVVRRPPPPAYWQKESLAGERILVWMEQGLGDQLLFASMLPDVIAQAGHCVIECAPRLVPIFARSFPAAAVVGNSELTFPALPPDGIDYQIAVGDLGQYFRPDADSFPRHEGYLQADPQKVETLRQRYEAAAQGRRLVGLSWQSRNAPESNSKSADLMAFAPILQTPGILFVNLQYGDCGRELAQAKKELGVDIFHDREVDPLKDMDVFFAQVAAMDLVVTTSNTTAHVAGTMDKPVWVLLPPTFGLLWYWFLKREDSPWYPSARLFRAPRLNLAEPWWNSVVPNAASALRDWAASGP